MIEEIKRILRGYHPLDLAGDIIGATSIIALLIIALCATAIFGG